MKSQGLPSQSCSADNEGPEESRVTLQRSHTVRQLTKNRDKDLSAICTEVKTGAQGRVQREQQADYQMPTF